MVDETLLQEWEDEAHARRITEENRRRVANGEAYVNDNEKHSPILVLKNAAD